MLYLKIFEFNFIQYIKKKFNLKAAIICHGQSTNSNSSEVEKPEGLEAFGFMTVFVIGFSVLSLIMIVPFFVFIQKMKL
jgi:hypothetical protein